MGQETTVAEIERRLKKVEDELEIIRLIASYSPLVDSGASDRAPRIWRKDGVYDIDNLRMESAAEIEAMLATEAHQAYVRAGSAHVMGLPWVEVNGDSAVAVNYSRVYVRDGEGYRVDRVSGNHWKLERTAEGWRVRERVNRLVRPGGPSKSLMSEPVPVPPAV